MKHTFSIVVTSDDGKHQREFEASLDSRWHTARDVRRMVEGMVQNAYEHIEWLERGEGVAR